MRIKPVLITRSQGISVRNHFELALETRGKALPWVVRKFNQFRIKRAVLSLNKARICKLGCGLEWALVFFTIPNTPNWDVDDEALKWLRKGLKILDCEC